MIICSSPKVSQTFSFDMLLGKIISKRWILVRPTTCSLPLGSSRRHLLPLTAGNYFLLRPPPFFRFQQLKNAARTLLLPELLRKVPFFWIGFGGNLCFLTSQYSVVALADGGKFRYFFHCFWFKVEALVRLSRIASGGVSFIYIYIYIIFLHHPGLPRPASCSFRILLNCLHLWWSCWFFYFFNVFFSSDSQRVMLILLVGVVFFVRIFHEANTFLMRSWDGLGCAEKWLEKMSRMNTLNF